MMMVMVLHSDGQNESTDTRSQILLQLKAKVAQSSNFLNESIEGLLENTKEFKESFCLNKCYD